MFFTFPCFSLVLIAILLPLPGLNPVMASTSPWRAHPNLKVCRDVVFQASSRPLIIVYIIQRFWRKIYFTSSDTQAHSGRTPACTGALRTFSGMLWMKTGTHSRRSPVCTGALRLASGVLRAHSGLHGRTPGAIRLPLGRLWAHLGRTPAYVGALRTRSCRLCRRSVDNHGHICKASHQSGTGPPEHLDYTRPE